MIVEEVKPALSWEESLGSTPRLSCSPETRATIARAKIRPQRRTWMSCRASRHGFKLKKWMTEDVQKTLGAPNASFHQKTLDEYRRLLSSAEALWVKTDQLLALHKHAAATTDTFESWAKLAGDDQDVKNPSRAASNVPTGAKYHIDLFARKRGPLSGSPQPRRYPAQVDDGRLRFPGPESDLSPLLQQGPACAHRRSRRGSGDL